MTERTPLDRAWAPLTPPWTEIEIVDEIDSTNSAIIGRRPGSILVAEYQTAGRGRLDRTWVSPPRAGLSVSVLIRPEPSPAAWGWLPLLAGLAVTDVVDSAVLKWPNDVLIGSPRRKLAGILAQATPPDVIIGIGLNVSTTAAELPIDTATSLAIEGVAADRTTLLADLLQALGRRIGEWTSAGGRGRVAEYTSRCATIGQLIRVHGLDSSITEGEAVGVDDSGRLIVLVDGERRLIAAGDVEHVRPMTQ